MSNLIILMTEPSHELKLCNLDSCTTLSENSRAGTDTTLTKRKHLNSCKTSVAKHFRHCLITTQH